VFSLLLCLISRSDTYPHCDDGMKKKHQSKPNSSRSLGLGHKLGQLFWSKSKSKSSLGNQSEESGSTSGLGSSSSRCTPDSSLSICVSTSEPNNENAILREGNVTLVNDQTALYRFDDCERYAANMYYNMMGDGDSTYTLRMKPRNNSVPLEGSSSCGGNGRKNPHREILEDCVQPYYNNMTFSTFPNPRRHSIAYSSTGSSSTNGRRGSKLKEVIPPLVDEVIEQDRDGYLRPKESRNLRMNNFFFLFILLH
jgi:hypothetical protein